MDSRLHGGDPAVRHIAHLTDPALIATRCVDIATVRSLPGAPGRHGNASAPQADRRSHRILRVWRGGRRLKVPLSPSRVVYLRFPAVYLRAKALRRSRYEPPPRTVTRRTRRQATRCQGRPSSRVKAVPTSARITKAASTSSSEKPDVRAASRVHLSPRKRGPIWPFDRKMDSRLCENDDAVNCVAAVISARQSRIATRPVSQSTSMSNFRAPAASVMRPPFDPPSG